MNISTAKGVISWDSKWYKLMRCGFISCLTHWVNALRSEYHKFLKIKPMQDKYFDPRLWNVRFMQIKLCKCGFMGAITRLAEEHTVWCIYLKQSVNKAVTAGTDKNVWRENERASVTEKVSLCVTMVFFCTFMCFWQGHPWWARAVLTAGAASQPYLSSVRFMSRSKK